jgi:thiol-disulfide isomerase/thioredoxin
MLCCYYFGMKLSLNLTVLLAALLVAACQINPRFSKLTKKEQAALQPATTSAAEINRGQMAENYAANESAGDAVNISRIDAQLLRQALDSNPNSLTHLYIYGTFCKPCVAELPTILQLHEKKQDVNFIMVTPENWGSLDRIKAFLQANNVARPTYILDLNKYGDEFVANKRYRKFMDEIYPGHPEIGGFPTHLILDKRQKVVFAAVGAGKFNAAVLDSVKQASR